MMNLRKMLRTSVVSLLLACMLVTLAPGFKAEADATWAGGSVVLSLSQIDAAVKFAKTMLNSGKDDKNDKKIKEEYGCTKTKYATESMTYCDEFVRDCYVIGAKLPDKTSIQISKDLVNLSRPLIVKGVTIITQTEMDEAVAQIVNKGKVNSARERAIIAFLRGELHVDGSEPPVGACVYWEWASPRTSKNLGHAGFYIGENKVINVWSQENGYMGTSKISTINNWSKHGGYHYLGWSAPAGFTFGQGTTTPPKDDNDNDDVKDDVKGKVKSYLDDCKSHIPTCVTIRVSKDTAPVWSLPCSSATDNRSVKLKTLEKGDFLNASEIWENSKHHYWYKVEIDGKTGYIYGDNTIAVGISDDVLTSNSKVILATRTPKKGSSCRISGFYASDSAKIISVTGTLESTKFTNPSKEKQTVTVKVNGKRLDFQPSDINKNLKFGKLPKGKGSLNLYAVFEADYIDGTVLKTKQFPLKKLHTLEFTVK